jgi:hypothetical protein
MRGEATLKIPACWTNFLMVIAIAKGALAGADWP